MSKAKTPVTAAIRLLRQHKVEFSDHLYEYEERGGTAHSAHALGLPEHAVVKTLIMEDDRHDPLIVLMHGDLQVSTKELARQIGARSIAPCAPEVANRHSGYLVGGTSPFGTRHAMPVYVEATILELPRIWINGGKRGYLIGIEPSVLSTVLKPLPVRVGIPG